MASTNPRDPDYDPNAESGPVEAFTYDQPKKTSSLPTSVPPARPLGIRSQLQAVQPRIDNPPPGMNATAWRSNVGNVARQAVGIASGYAQSQIPGGAFAAPLMRGGVKGALREAGGYVRDIGNEAASLGYAAKGALQLGWNGQMPTDTLNKSAGRMQAAFTHQPYTREMGKEGPAVASSVPRQVVAQPTRVVAGQSIPEQQPDGSIDWSSVRPDNPVTDGDGNVVYPAGYEAGNKFATPEFMSFSNRPGGGARTGSVPDTQAIRGNMNRIGSSLPSQPEEAEYSPEPTNYDFKNGYVRGGQPLNQAAIREMQDRNELGRESISAQYPGIDQVQSGGQSGPRSPQDSYFAPPMVSETDPIAMAMASGRAVNMRGTGGTVPGRSGYFSKRRIESIGADTRYGDDLQASTQREQMAAGERNNMRTANQQQSGDEMRRQSDVERLGMEGRKLTAEDKRFLAENDTKRRDAVLQWDQGIQSAKINAGRQTGNNNAAETAQARDTLEGKKQYFAQKEKASLGLAADPGDINDFLGKWAAGSPGQLQPEQQWDYYTDANGQEWRKPKKQ